MEWVVDARRRSNGGGCAANSACRVSQLNRTTHTAISTSCQSINLGSFSEIRSAAKLETTLDHRGGLLGPREMNRLVARNHLGGQARDANGAHNRAVGVAYGNGQRGQS